MPPGRLRPKILIDYGGANPHEVDAICFSARDRTAKFLVDKGTAGDRLLDMLGKYPEAPARLVTSYGVDGWVVKVD